MSRTASVTVLVSEREDGACVRVSLSVTPIRDDDSMTHEYQIKPIDGRGNVFVFRDLLNHEANDGWRVHTVLKDEGNEKYKILFERTTD